MVVTRRNLPKFVNDAFNDPRVIIYNFDLEIGAPNSVSVMINIKSPVFGCAEFAIAPYFDGNAYGLYFDESIREEYIKDSDTPLQVVLQTMFSGKCRVLREKYKVTAIIELANGETISGINVQNGVKELPELLTFSSYPRV